MIPLAYWMLGVAIAHALRFVVLDDPLNRMVVAGAGTAVYLTAAVLAFLGKRDLAHTIAVVFPVVGLLTVVVTGGMVDNWQLAVGVTQYAAVAYVVHERAHEVIARRAKS